MAQSLWVNLIDFWQLVTRRGSPVLLPGTLPLQADRHPSRSVWIRGWGLSELLGRCPQGITLLGVDTRGHKVPGAKLPLGPCQLTSPGSPQVFVLIGYHGSPSVLEDWLEGSQGIDHVVSSLRVGAQS